MKNVNEDKQKTFDERCDKAISEINDAQNERQQAENKAFNDYMDTCNDILEKYGFFPKDHPPSDQQIKVVDALLDLIKFKRKVCELPIIENIEHKYNQQVLIDNIKENKTKLDESFKVVKFPSNKKKRHRRNG